MRNVDRRVRSIHSYSVINLVKEPNSGLALKSQECRTSDITIAWKNLLNETALGIGLQVEGRGNSIDSQQNGETDSRRTFDDENCNCRTLLGPKNEVLQIRWMKTDRFT